MRAHILPFFIYLIPRSFPSSFARPVTSVISCLEITFAMHAVSTITKIKVNTTVMAVACAEWEGGRTISTVRSAVCVIPSTHMKVTDV